MPSSPKVFSTDSSSLIETRPAAHNSDETSDQALEIWMRDRDSAIKRREYGPENKGVASR